MPFHVQCPGCARPIACSHEESAAGVKLECAQCNTLFRVGPGHGRPVTVLRGRDRPTELHLPPPGVVETLARGEAPAPGPPPGMKVGLAAAGASAFLAVLATFAGHLVYLAHRPGAPSGSPAPPPAKLTPASVAVAPPGHQAGDPWPECARVRQWLAENTPDPGGIEIIKWEGRKPMSKPGHFIITTRYRGTNQYGGKSVEVREFSVDGDQLFWAQPVAGP